MVTAKQVINSIKPIQTKEPQGETKKGSAGYDNIRDDIEKNKSLKELNISKFINLDDGVNRNFKIKPRYDEESDRLHFESVDAGACGATVFVFNNSIGDGTENLMLAIVGKGNPESFENREMLTLGYFPEMDAYLLGTMEAGTGVAKPLVVFAGDGKFLYFGTDGKIGFNYNFEIGITEGIAFNDSVRFFDLINVDGDIYVNDAVVIDSNKFFKPVNSADASAPVNSIYFSSTAGKLVYKDSGGTVNNLY